MPVDDTLRHRHLWEEAGGTLIHHRSAETTLAELSGLGVPVSGPLATSGWGREQMMTVAARAMTENKTVGQRS